MNILGFTFVLIFTNAWAGNLSDLVRCGSGGGESSGVVGNQTYYSVGGSPNFCKSSSLNKTGGFTYSNVNNGNTCGAGKVCSRGTCTSVTVTCSSSSVIGDVCTGGAVYAGQFGGNNYMITPSNCIDSTCSNLDTAAAGDTYTTAWATGGGNPAYGVATGATSLTNGVTNTNILAGSYTDTNAAKFCQNLIFGGYTDWYLPAIDELIHLYANRSAFGFDTAVNYWSSTEQTINNAYYMNINGTRTSYDRSYSYHVRCVRRF